MLVALLNRQSTRYCLPNIIPSNEALAALPTGYLEEAMTVLKNNLSSIR